MCHRVSLSAEPVCVDLMSSDEEQLPCSDGGCAGSDSALQPFEVDDFREEEVSG